MSAAEVLHRVGEQMRRARSRAAPPLAVTDYRGDDVPLPVWPGLADGVRSLAADRSLAEGWRAHTGTVAQGGIRLLGTDWPPHAQTPDWHLDPVSGQHWPRDAYCFDSVHRFPSGGGDVKFVWELGRLQYLQPIAAHACVSRDERAAGLCTRHLLSWIETNPPYRGVHWASGIEQALRVVSMLVVTSLLGDAFDEHESRAVVRSLNQHGYWIDRFPSRHSSANNHLVAEAAALFFLGTLAPGLPGATRYREYGRRTLLEETQRQIHPDGVGAEQSPAYLALTLEWLLLSADLAARRGQPFPGEFWERMAAAAEFLKWITDGSGNQPRIGDDDESRVVGSGMVEPTMMGSVLACTAAATARPELAPPNPRAHLRNALLPLPVDTSEAPTGVRHFETGGYTVARAAASRELPAYLAVFDHGPVGHLSIAAHGHADSLALWLHVADEPVLVDAGTYLYHGSDGWREHYRSTVAHNTLALDGGGSSRSAGRFNWVRKAEARVLCFDAHGAEWSIEAEHDGFRDAHGVFHRRRLATSGCGRFELTDRLIGGRGSQLVEIGFLVSPALRVARGEVGFEVYDGDTRLLEIAHEGRLDGRVEEGGTSPRRGWYSPCYGVQRPAPRIAYYGRLAPGEPARFTLSIGGTPRLGAPLP
jgi:hypothetical protein